MTIATASSDRTPKKRVRRRVPIGTLVVPKLLGARDGVMLFRTVQHIKPNECKEVSVRPGLLKEFLEETTDQGVVTFAKKYGPLGLFDETASTDPQELSETIGIPDAQHMGSSGLGFHREHVLWWRAYRTEFAFLLRLMQFVRGRPVQIPEDAIHYVNSRGLFFPVPMLGSDLQRRGWDLWASWKDHHVKVAAAREYLTRRLNQLILWSTIQPVLVELEPSAEKTQTTPFDVEFRCDRGLTLFGALTIELLAAVLDRGWRLCGTCGSMFVPQHQQWRSCPPCMNEGEPDKAKREAYNLRQRQSPKRAGKTKSTATTRRRKRRR